MKRELIGDRMWAALAPLLPEAKPSALGGRPRVDDRAAFNGILFILFTGIPWKALPTELGFGSGMTCWRRLHEWHEAGVWDQLHRCLLQHLREFDQIDWSRCSIDGATVASPRGVKKLARTRQTEASSAANVISS